MNQRNSGDGAAAAPAPAPAASDSVLSDEEFDTPAPAPAVAVTIETTGNIMPLFCVCVAWGSSGYKPRVCATRKAGFGTGFPCVRVVALLRPRV